MRIHKSPLFPANFLAEHDNFVNAKDDILGSMMDLHLTSIPLIVGPSGVGKTTLIKKAASEMHEYVLQNPDLGFTPPIIIEARSPEYSFFEWGGLYHELLIKLGEPLIKKKISISTEIARLKENKSKNNSSKMKVKGLRDLLEKCVDARNPIAIIVDECQSIANKNKSEQAKYNALDVIKSLSNQKQGHIKLRFMLTGTYDAYDSLVTNEQLSRRVKLIDFSRYKLEDDATEIFHELIKTFIDAGYPLSKTLLDHATYCANHSLGCIGNFIEWLSSAHQKAYQLNKKNIDLESLKHTRMTNRQLQTLALAIRQFENTHHRFEDFDEASLFNTETQRAKPKNITRSHKPGVRSPKRDLLSTY